jgi:MFS family permease
MDHTVNTKKSNIFYGWWIVFSCSVIALISGSSRFSFTMFFPTLIDDLGWTRAMLGFGLTLHMWVYAVTVIFSGYIVDKYGARVIMCIGGVIIIIGLALASTMTKVWHFYLYYGVILAIGVALSFMVPILGTIRKWFIKKAGLALALTNVGGGLGGALMAVIIPTMILAFGWRNAWLYLGFILGAIIIILAAIFIRKDPESMGLLPDGTAKIDPKEITGESQQAQSGDIEEIWTVREAMKTRSFWCLLIAGCVSAIPGIGITGHIAAWGVDIAKTGGITAIEAMGHIKLAVSLSAIAVIVGGMIGGPLSDRIGRKLIICLGLGADSVLFLFVAQIDTLMWVVISAILMGFFGGFIGPAAGAYLGDIFGRYALATIFSLMVFAIGIVGGAGSVIFGWIYDINGSYDWAWIISSVLMAITLILYSLTRKEVKG